MVSPTDSMNLVETALERSDEIPDDMSYLGHEPDMTGQDSDVNLPMISIEPVDVDHVHLHNTDLVGWETDEEGNRIGRIYYAEYELTMEVDIWTAAGGKYDVDDLGTALRETLYQYSSHGPNKPLKDEDGVSVDGIFRFVVGRGERQDEVIRTPTLRRWRHEVELWGYEEFKTTHDYIVDVTFPDPDVMELDNVSG